METKHLSFSYDLISRVSSMRYECRIIITKVQIVVCNPNHFAVEEEEAKY